MTDFADTLFAALCYLAERPGGNAYAPRPRAGGRRYRRHRRRDSEKHHRDALIRSGSGVHGPTTAHFRGFTMTRMLGSDAILRSLEAEGVEVMFGIPGGAILPTYDAIARGTTVRHVLARHEQGAGHMAEGYARASGKPASLSPPPVPARRTRHRDRRCLDGSTPIVCVTGQVGVEPDRQRRVPGDRHDRDHDADREAHGSCRTSRSCRRGSRTRSRSRSPAARAPCSSTLPRTSKRPNPKSANPARPICPPSSRRRRPHERQIREAAKMIAEAKRPIVYAGSGVLRERVGQAARARRARQDPRHHYADGEGLPVRLAIR